MKGGGELRIHEISKRLVKEDVDTTIVCMGIKDVDSIEDVDGIRVVHLGPVIKDLPKRGLIDFIYYTLSSLKYLLTNKCDVIEANTYIPLIPAFIAGFLKRTPVIATIHDVYGGQWSGQYNPWMAGLIERLLVKLPFTRIVTVSSYTKERLVKDYGIAAEKIRIIHNGVDLEYFDSINESKSGDNTILFIGRLIEHKHVDDLINAITIVKKIHPKVRLSIIGDGVNEKNLKDLVIREKLGDNVIFNGILDGMDVVKKIKSCRMLVLPSTKEGFGIVLAEANACSKPVIAYDCGGVVDVIEDGVNGFLVKPRDIKELSVKISLLLSDDKLTNELGRNGRKKVEELFTWNMCSKKYMSVLKENNK